MKHALALLLLALPALAQTPDTTYVWALVGGRFQILQVEGAQIDKTFTPPKVRLGPPPTLQAGAGIVLAGPVNGVTTVSVNSAQILYRVTPPTAPGKCDEGTGAIAADSQYFYLCVPDGTGGFVWARSPAQTVW